MNLHLPDSFLASPLLPIAEDLVTAEQMIATPSLDEGGTATPPVDGGIKPPSVAC